MNDTKSIFELDENTSIKEFMETFVNNYEGHWLPSDIDPLVYKLEGYKLGLGDGEASRLISQTIEQLRNMKTLLDAIKHRSNWKYK